jgi:hypothetical protein
MKSIETVGSQESEVVSRKSHSQHKYAKVLDGRKQPVRGLWQRNGKFIARIAIEDEAGMKSNRWVALKGAVTVAQAQKQLKTLHVDRTRNDLPMLKRTPKFADYAAQYFAYHDTVKDAKRPATIEKERGAIKLWNTHPGGMRLDKIRRIHINSFIQKVASRLRDSLRPAGFGRRLNQCGRFNVALQGDEQDRLRVIYRDCSAVIVECGDSAHHPLSVTQIRSRAVTNIHIGSCNPDVQFGALGDDYLVDFVVVPFLHSQRHFMKPLRKFVLSHPRNAPLHQAGHHQRKNYDPD